MAVVLLTPQECIQKTNRGVECEYFWASDQGVHLMVRLVNKV